MNLNLQFPRVLASVLHLWLCLGFLLPSARTATPHPWTVTGVTPTPSHLAHVLHEAGIFVAVGNDQQGGPTILTSTNGTDWVQHNTGFSANLTSVAFGAGKFVAIGSDLKGEVLVMESTDATRWNVVSKTLPQNTTRIAFGNGIFVAAGQSDLLWTSTNGIDWKSKQLGSAANLYQLKFLNQHFVGVGTGLVLYSTNGVDWIQSPTGNSQPLYDIEYGAGYYWAVGGGFGRDRGIESASSNLRDWTTIPIVRFDGPILAISATATDFVAIDSQGRFMGSTNGWRWTETFASANTLFQSLANGDGRFVAVGGNFSTYGVLMTSKGPLDWETVFAGTVTLTRAATGNGLSIAIGEGGAFQSQDGTDWKRIPSRSEYLKYRINDITFLNGEFLAAANFGRILATDTGRNWIARYTTPGAEDFTGIASSHGVLFATSLNGISGSHIFRSLDATHWEAVASGGMDSLRAIACSDDTTVAVGDRGLLMVSTNSESWLRPQNIDSLFFFQGIAYGNGHFVAVASRSDGILTSSDGVNWRQTSPLGAIEISFNHGWFVALQGGNQVLISRDGLFWRSAELPAFGRPTGIAALPGQFTIFSTSGYISSAWLGDPELLKSTRAGNGLSLTIRAQTGKPLDLWSSSTLEPALWTHTPFFTPLESYTTRVLAEPFNSTLRVYRIGQSNLAPASITGRTLEVRILTGWGMLASAGSYRFSTSPTGNRYTITPIDGPIMSDAGTYGYSILAMDRARLMLTNQLGWVLKTDIRLESATQGDTSSQLISTSSGEQFGTFDLK